jgi:hypothetical protein
MNFNSCVENNDNDSVPLPYLVHTPIFFIYSSAETKGLNEEFGFHINRPFYIVSELPFNRVAEMHGNTQVNLKRWRKNTRQQQWWFDEVSKTVRNNYWKNYALDIQGNGGSSNLRTAGINSRWW